jgi:hypothetical protein
MKIKWIGEMREIPNYGTKSDGDIFELPEDMAISLISQGLAVQDEDIIPAPKNKRTKGE